MFTTYSSLVTVWNATFVPSWEMNGNLASIGGNVSCIRSLPSLWLRQIVCSGYVAYATHLPSREKVGSVAEMPPRNGTNCPDFMSYRTSSPRCFAPRTKICFPSRLGHGNV